MKIDMLAATKRFFTPGNKVHPQMGPLIDNWVTDKTEVIPMRKPRVIRSIPRCPRTEVRVWDTLSIKDQTATKRKKVTCWVSLFDVFQMKAYYYLRAIDRDGLPIGWYSEKGKKLGKVRKWVTNDVSVWMSPVKPGSVQAWHQHRVSNGVWEHRVRLKGQSNWEIVSYNEFYRMAWEARPN